MGAAPGGAVKDVSGMGNASAARAAATASSRRPLGDGQGQAHVISGGTFSIERVQ